MGDVYQATDLKLGLSVAIELLPSAFASDAERLFVEALAIAKQIVEALEAADGGFPAALTST